MTNLKQTLLLYIQSSPYCYEHKDWEAMSEEELLNYLDAGVDDCETRRDGHTYKMVKIDSYDDALKYVDYASDWCIVESSGAFDEHTKGGNQFYFFERDDMRRYHRKTFGDGYPYDNYGLSLIALCVDKRGNIVSITSRWNYEENYDHYFDRQGLEEVINARLDDILPKREIGISTILHISDTHGRHRELTNLSYADVIVHSGDFTRNGSEEEAYDFMNWLCDLPHPHKIFIAGNHDDCMYGCESIEGLPEEVHYLHNRSVVIGGLKFHGISLFNDDICDGTMRRNISRIPLDTDILVTHQPSYSICDLADYGKGLEHRGDHELKAKVETMQLMYHLFGHEHDAYGTAKHHDTVFSNAALADINYNLVNKPKLFELK
jgi:Icc-related predicted phosphoesterase